ncbi:hypothetical protein C7405_101644 [Paraburkholderia caballeronis]|uniref:phage baseplate protein n=1 Tax=Paraburkholderia caballeronis TaxID=416943 RepID=UPI0010D394AA|nr:hypothetical protein [Paraburkholderia caballeronis]TDV39525.1 hypothetical protein C7405_101644 [Paraburkholderia caballeronis]
MSTIAGLALAGAAALLDSVMLTSKSIGSVTLNVIVEEIHSDALAVTEHPVELGAPISDHAYMRPREVVIRCGWSNADYDALLGTVQSAISSVGNLLGIGGGSSNGSTGSSAAGNQQTDSSYVGQVYSQLLALQASRKVFDVTTSRRMYQNMLMTSLSATTDPKTNEVLMVAATCREIFIVTTQSTTLPPTENQANPAATAETANAGTQSAIPGNPAPGGSVPPSKFTFTL